MKVKINLTSVIAQAAGKIYESDGRALLFLWLGRNNDQPQMVEVDVPDEAIKVALEKSTPVRTERKEQYAVRPLMKRELTSAVGVKWEVCDLQAPKIRNVALCYTEVEARRICALLNRLDVEADTKPL